MWDDEGTEMIAMRLMRLLTPKQWVNTFKVMTDYEDEDPRQLLERFHGLLESMDDFYGFFDSISDEIMEELLKLNFKKQSSDGDVEDYYEDDEYADDY